MSENKIAAVTRTEFGKGAARRARRAGLVPAVVYGHGTDPVHISVPGHDVLLALRVANALLTLSIDGGREILALGTDLPVLAPDGYRVLRLTSELDLAAGVSR